MNQADIVYVSRPLSNRLDEGSKNLVYYLAKRIKVKIQVFTQADFNLPLSETVQSVVIESDSKTRWSTAVPDIKVKNEIFRTLLSIRDYECAHTFFTLTPINSAVLLWYKFITRKKLIIFLPSLNQKTLKSPMVAMLLRRVDATVVMTEHTFKKIENFTDKIFKIPPLIDSDIYFPVTKVRRAELRDRLGIQSAKVVIFPGEYSRIDANSNMIKIVRTVLKSMPEVLFIFSCRIKYHRDIILKREIEKKLEGCNVLFIENVENYHEFSGAADIGVFPPKKMAGKFDLPLSIVELMAQGKPVFHTDIQPLNELYRNPTDYCFRTADQISEKLLKTFKSQNYYEDLVKRTISESERFSSKNVVKQYGRLYEKVLGNKSRIT